MVYFFPFGQVMLYLVRPFVRASLYTRSGYALFLGHEMQYGTLWATHNFNAQLGSVSRAEKVSTFVETHA